jgi:RimJ/RimL family protein N-acetyltransferase
MATPPRAVELVVQRLAADGGVHTATLTIDRANTRSLKVARTARFQPVADIEHNRRFSRTIER